MERAFIETARLAGRAPGLPLEAGPGGRRRLARAAVGGDRRRTGGSCGRVARGASTGSASCGSRIIPSRSRSCGGCSGSTSSGMRSAARPLFHAPGRYAEGVALLSDALARCGEDADPPLRPRVLRVRCRVKPRRRSAHVAPPLQLDLGLRTGTGARPRTSPRSQSTRGSRRSSARLARRLGPLRVPGEGALPAVRHPRLRGRLATTPAEAARRPRSSAARSSSRPRCSPAVAARPAASSSPRRPRRPRRRPRRFSASTSAATSSAALDRAGVGDREGVLPLGHLRPRREAAAVHVHDRGRRGHRGGRGDEPGGARPAPRRSARGLPALAGAPAVYGAGVDDPASRSRSRRSSGGCTRRSSAATRCSARSTR